MQDINHHVGIRIRLYRKLKRYTLDALAQKIHKSKATLSKYENGDITVDVETLFDLAEALQVTVYQLLDVGGKEPDPQAGECHRFFARSWVYVYFYDGRYRKLVRNMLEIRQGGGTAAVTFYNDLPSLEKPEACRNLYFGHMESFDTVTNFILESQSNHVEQMTLTAMNPLDRRNRVAGMLTGMNRDSLLPVSIKVCFSTEPLEENEALEEELMLSAKDIKTIKKLNMFTVEQ